MQKNLFFLFFFFVFADYEPTGRIVSCMGSDIQCIEYTQGGSTYNVYYDQMENTFTRLGKHVEGGIHTTQNDEDLFSCDPLEFSWIEH